MSETLITIPDTLRKIIFICCLLACIIFPIITSPYSLLMGLIISLTIGHPYIKYNKKATTLLLQISIVCLGFGTNLNEALKAGRDGFFFTVSTIVVTLTAGYLIGKWFKIDKTTSFLISNGTAICGGSAIAAVAPIMKATDQQISVALGTVFILNSIALFIFPTLGHMLHLSDSQFGTWCAIAIHDTSSVTGAAKEYSPKALAIATTIKLERALWIIPISLATAYFQKSTGKIKIPYFIFYFLLAIVISTYFPISLKLKDITTPGNVLTPYQYAALIGKRGLVVTLFLIGSGLSIKNIKQVGWRPVLQGVLLWILIGSVSLLVIRSTVS